MVGSALDSGLDGNPQLVNASIENEIPPSLVSAAPSSSVESIVAGPITIHTLGTSSEVSVSEFGNALASSAGPNGSLMAEDAHQPTAAALLADTDGPAIVAPAPHMVLDVSAMNFAAPAAPSAAGGLSTGASASAVGDVVAEALGGAEYSTQDIPALAVIANDNAISTAIANLASGYDNAADALSMALGSFTNFHDLGMAVHDTGGVATQA
jgi:hypothetical protein